MNNSQKKHRMAEFCKDVLMILLTCSAVWLAARSQLFGTLSGFWQEETPIIGPVQTQGGARADAARPLRITANLQGGVEILRYGVQYDTAASDTLFQQVAGLLVESLSSAGEPEQITRTQWEQALITAPGVSLDFQGELPMPVLVGWLMGENTALTATVRRVTLTMWQGAVAVYYRDENSGLYFRCMSEVTNELHLTPILPALTENEIVYAFESELYRNLDPDTLILETAPAPAVYHAANPVSGGQSALKDLMTDLDISIDASSFYATGAEWVARNESDSLRLSERGVAIYEAGEENSDRFRISAPRGETSIFDSVEACRQLAAVTVGARCGQARLYLMSAQESKEGLVVRFGYSLNGSTVQLEGNCAASFLVKDGQITQFQLNFRSYTSSGETSVVLPALQAAAAMEALGLEGEELLLVYGDSGADTVTASWAAVSNLAGEG